MLFPGSTTMMLGYQTPIRFLCFFFGTFCFYPTDRAQIRKCIRSETKKKCSWWGFICFTALNFVLRFESWTTYWMNSALWEYYFYMALQSADLQVTCHYWARVAQWWEHSPSTDVARVQILASTPYVGWVCCWFSPLTQEVSLRVPQFPPLLKNRHLFIFQYCIVFYCIM